MTVVCSITRNEVTPQDEKTLTATLTANRFFRGEFDDVRLCAGVV